MKYWVYLLLCLIWAENALVEIVTKYKKIELTNNSVNAMREEFKQLGLESVMPLALNSILDNDKIN